MATTKINLLSVDIGKLVTKEAKPKNFELSKKMKFDIAIEIDKELADQIENDDKLSNAIFSAVSDEYKKCLKMVVNVTKFTDKRMEKENRQSVAKQWEDDVDGYFSDVEKNILKAAETEIQAWLKVRKDRTKYKIKLAAKLTVGALTVAAASLGTAVAAVGGGAGLVVAIYGNVKAVINLMKEIITLAQDCDTAEKKLKKDLAAVVAAYKDYSKKAVAANEMGAALIDTLFTYQKSSISKCESELETFSGKLAGLQIKCSDLSQKLSKILDLQTELDKKILEKSLKELTVLKYKSKLLPGLKQNLKKSVQQTTDQIGKMEKLYKQTDLAKKHETIYENTLADLKKKKDSWVGYAEKGLGLIDLGLGAGFTDFSSLEQVLVFINSLEAELDKCLAEEL